jgi:flagellar biosynthesis protein FlhF
VLRQADLVRSVDGVDLHVVLSAASGAMELAAAAERYRVLDPDHLLISKIDEAAGPGSFVSAAVRIGRPISAVSNGQRVPEDLLVVKSADLTELVVGPWN